MNEIDVHIIHMPQENKVWEQQCIQSLQGHPINIFHVDGVPGDIRQARLDGYNQGSAKYVSFVDPDDYVFPGAFDYCLNVLNSNPDVGGCYTLSNHIKVTTSGDNDIGLLHNFRPWNIHVGRTNVLEIHQLVVMRRNLVIPLYERIFNDIPKMVYTEPYFYWQLARIAPWIAINYVGYAWRDHSDSTHAKNKPTQLEMNHALNFIRCDHTKHLSY